MATVNERPGTNWAASISKDNRSVTIAWVVSGAADLESAMALAEAQSLSTYPSILGATIGGVDLIEELRTDQNTGLRDYEIGVKYSNGDKEKQEGDEVTTFSTTGGTSKITQSLGTTKYRNDGTSQEGPPLLPGDPPEFYGAINVTDNGPEGCEIVVPKLEMSVKKYRSPAFITSANVKAISDLTGKTNDTTFKGFEAGEVLFLGAEGEQKGDKPAEVTYKFGLSPNVTFDNLAGAANVEKKGWQYLWFYYELRKDGTSERLARFPVAVYVETVYESDDLSQLGLGS